MSACSKCSTTERLTRHHVIPLFVFPSKRRNKYTVTLCRSCHNDIENNILAVESFQGNTRFGVRHPLPHKDYEKILRNFLKESKAIVHLAV